MTSAVLIVPAAIRPAAEIFGQSQGWGPSNFTVPLSADGGLTITHYGCRTDVGPNFDDLFLDPPQGAESLADVVIRDFSDSIKDDAHFAAVIDAIGMVRM